jgi:hypothetical protein
MIPVGVDAEPFSLQPMLCQSAEKLPEGREWRCEFEARRIPRDRLQSRAHCSAMVAPIRRISSPHPAVVKAPPSCRTTP